MKYLTQKEVADRFRVSPSTIINWRERGLLAYFQAPESSRVLYPLESVEELERQFTHKKGGITKKPAKATREKPGLSTKPKREWRI